MTNRTGLTPETEWNAARYDAQHAFVWKYAASVVELLAPQPGERILDLGCGTGHLTAQIAASGAEVLGIDRSPNMIAQARQNYPDLHFEVADATDFHPAEPFDAVFSNAVLHWINRPAQVVACVWAALKPGGRFVAEFGGRGNIQAIVQAIEAVLETSGYSARPDRNPWYFPSVGEYASLLEAQGFRVTFAAHFDRPTPLDGGEQGLRNWLATFANDFLADVPPEHRPTVVQDIESGLRPKLFQDGAWIADYRRLRVVAVRESE